MALILIIVSANIFVVSVLGHHLNSGTNIKNEIHGIDTVKRTLYGKRGTIFDRNQEPLAIDNVAYTLYANIDPTRLDSKGNPAHVVDKPAAATIISEIIGKPYESVLEILNSKALEVQFGVQGKYITPEQKAALEESGIPGLGFYTVRNRVNPNRNYISKFLGYADFNEEKNVLEGKLGFELLLDDSLRGTNGFEQYQRDAAGYKLQSSQSLKEDAIDGKHVTLTIDKNIQSQLEISLEGITKDEKVTAKSAWGIVLEAKTGRILAMGEYPGFNPEDPNNNYQDTVTLGTYEPGSTLKTFSVASAIEKGTWDDERTFDSGAFYVGEKNGRPTRLPTSKGSIHTITNASNIDYGTITYAYGYAQSSNVLISELMSNYLTYDEYINDLKKLRFFQKSDIDGYPVASGSEAQDDISVLPQITNAFGQGMTVSMVQVAQAYTTLMGNGDLIKPYIIDSIKDPKTGAIEYQGSTQNLGKVYSAETAKHMRDLMRYVITGGSAMRFDLEEVEVIGKTGTAQMVVDGAYSPTQYIYSSALGFPYEDPEIIVYTAYIANTGHSIMASSNHVNDLVRTIVSTMNLQDNINQEVIPEIKAHTLDNFVNEDVSAVVTELEKNGLKPIIIGDGRRVIQQYPRSGQSIITNERVFIKTEGSQITMPNMEGWSFKEVVNYWTLSGVGVEMVGSGFVVEQSVEPGTILTSDTTVTITFK